MSLADFLSVDGAGIVFWPLVAALLVVGALALKVTKDTKGWDWLRERRGDVNFDFSKSWASTLTLVGALLGTMLSAGVLTEARDKARFAALNSVFLLLSLVAPLWYSAWARRTAKGAEGTMRSLLIASGLTLWAVFGQLAAMALVINQVTIAPPPTAQVTATQQPTATAQVAATQQPTATPTAAAAATANPLRSDLRISFFFFLLVAVVLMGVYAWQTLYAIANPPPEEPKAPAEQPTTPPEKAGAAARPAEAQKHAGPAPAEPTAQQGEAAPKQPWALL